MAMWSRSGCPLLASKAEDGYVSLRPDNDERDAQRLQSTAARRVMPRDDDVPFLVSSGVCVCPRLLCIAWPENGFMDVVARVHGHTMSTECLPLRSHSLLFHGPVFHSRCCLLAGIWTRAAAVWAVRLEMDWQHYNHWRDRAQLHSGIRSRPVSAR